MLSDFYLDYVKTNTSKKELQGKNIFVMQNTVEVLPYDEGTATAIKFCSLVLYTNRKRFLNF